MMAMEWRDQAWGAGRASFIPPLCNHKSIGNRTNGIPGQQRGGNR